MSYEFAKKEIGEYRITVYQDEDAECPCSAWDLAGVYLWENSGYGNRRLSNYCNYKEVFDACNHDLVDVLRELAYKYVPEDRLEKYLKSNKYKEKYYISEELTPYEIKNSDIFESMDSEELIELLNDIAYDIVLYRWSSTGYSQGDYVEGIAYCDKERFKKMVDNDTKDWKNRALALFEHEVESIGIWMWGDVKGYVLEKKRTYTKMYDDGETVKSYEWEEIDSCWGEYFKDADDLIEEVIKEHGLQPTDAA